MFAFIVYITTTNSFYVNVQLTFTSHNRYRLGKILKTDLINYENSKR